MKEIKIGSRVSEFFGWYSIVEEVLDQYKNIALVRATQDDGFTSYLILYYENDNWDERYSSSDREAIDYQWNILKENRQDS